MRKQGGCRPLKHGLLPGKWIIYSLDDVSACVIRFDCNFSSEHQWTERCKNSFIPRILVFFLVNVSFVVIKTHNNLFLDIFTCFSQFSLETSASGSGCSNNSTIFLLYVKIEVMTVQVTLSGDVFFSL